MLLPQLLEVLKEAQHLGELPATMNEAIIAVIPKPGKDVLEAESCRPISLLQVDVKILANRLNSVITSLIHTDQAGFMPNMLTAVNIRRLYLNIQAGQVHASDAVALLNIGT